MFIAHYKAVDKAKEFYSNRRSKLDFPTQVEYKNDKYLLSSTYIVSSDGLEKMIKEMAIKSNIDYNVELD